MLGVEVAVGYALAYLGQKLRRAGRHADGEVDRAVDVGMERVHALVSRALGDDDALRRAETAGEAGEISQEARERVTLALAEAVEGDPELATALHQAVEAVQAAFAASEAAHTGDRIAITGGVTFHADGGVAAVRMGNVTVNPPVPGPSQG
ncbi:hypothetical protein AQJ46_45900 [Streptomyces canus]|uniref:Chromosome partitioning protein n=1 Tax=Streptomyces canus TaxID=58343 RepID=A0A101RLH8_9ACTN|nr:hypothetical protein [Streptomyces canus]KUN57754.1 hypothetical protein AQJ46_45900 [Streptomyces canus]